MVTDRQAPTDAVQLKGSAWKRGIAGVVFFAAVLGGLLPEVVDAHPLGNFTINHYSRIEPAGNAIQIHYVLDMAEIPTFQDKFRFDANPEMYADAKANDLGSNLHLTLDGNPVALRVLARSLSFPEGQGGLPTLRLEVVYQAELPGNIGTTVDLSYRDDNDVDRIGWREIVVRPGNGETKIEQSSVSQQDQSDELRNYPADLLSSPLGIRSARVTFVRGGVAGVPTLANPALMAISHTQTAFAELATSELSLQAVLLAVVIAMFFGAQHALQPGHGKTIVAAYLVGSRGTPKHALFLGGTVTATHTAGVYLLGFVTLFLSMYVVPEKLYPVIGVVSGLVVVGMGGWLLFSRVRAIVQYRRVEHDHHDDALHIDTHPHDTNQSHSDCAQHTHHIAHSHKGDHPGLAHSHGGRTHSHIPSGANGDPITWRSLLALGVTGGALPCPEALVVLLATIALGRVAFGLLLILAFSIGLAGVLVGFGLLMVYARGWFGRAQFGSGLVPRLLSIASALIIVGAGSFITLQAGVQGF
jgi:nickel/cobalt transporter (NicO) family protein